MERAMTEGECLDDMLAQHLACISIYPYRVIHKELSYRRLFGRPCDEARVKMEIDFCTRSNIGWPNVRVEALFATEATPTTGETT